MDLTNKSFGSWIALYPIKKDKRIYWHCKCSCGVERDVLQYSLTSGKSTGCGHDKKKGKYYNDITGKKFGELTALSPTEKRDQGSIVWKCQCSCGNIVEWDVGRLQQTKHPHCGCLLDLTGQTFGKLTVLKRVPNLTKSRSYKYLCQCECGNLTEVTSSDLRRGAQKSCGCMKSKGEYNIIQCLINNNIFFQKEYAFPDLIDKAPLRYDFAIFDENNNLIRLVEFDGVQHFKDISFFNNFSQYQLHDKMKNQYAKDHQIPLVRIPYTEQENITIDLIMGDKYLVN